MTELAPEDLKIIRQMAATGHKIEALKKVRDVTGLGLVQASLIVDGILSGELHDRGEASTLQHDLEEAARIEDKARGGEVRRLLGLLALLFVVSAGGAYYLVQRQGGENAILRVVQEETRKKPAPEEILDLQEDAVNVETVAEDPLMKTLTPINGVLWVDVYRDFQFVGGLLSGSEEEGQAGEPFTAKPVEKPLGQPKYRSSDVLYSHLSLGNGADKRILMALDNTETPTLYLDTNNDEDLTNDGATPQNQAKSGFAGELFLTIEVLDEEGRRAKVPYQLWLEVDGTTKAFTFSPRFRYEAVVELDGERYSALIMESPPFDGLLRDSGIWIDLNRDGKFEEEGEHFKEGDTFRGGAGEYQVRLLHS